MSRHDVTRNAGLKYSSTSYVISIGFFVIAAALYVLPTFIPLYIGTGYIVLYLFMMAMCLYVWRQQILTPKHCLFLGVALCVFLLPLNALTSNDAQRYLWDGAVFLNGFDPYITGPDDEVLATLRTIWPTPAEHAAYPTLYPPGALMIVAICAGAGPVYGFWLWKLSITLAAIASFVLVYDLLKAQNKLRNFCLMGLSPLLLFEMGAGAHLDIFCVLGIVGALWCVQKDKILLAGIIIGVSATIKFLPAVIAGPYLFYLKPKKALKLFLGASLSWGLIYASMFGLGYKPLGLLPTFFEKWRGGAPFYPVLETLQNKAGLSHTQFLFMLGSLAVIGFGLSAWRARKGSIYTAIMIALATPLLLSPILFSWYLMVFIPLLALKPNMTVISALALTPLSYTVLNKWLSNGVWEPALWPSIVLAVGIVGGIGLDWLRPLTAKKELI